METNRIGTIPDPAGMPSTASGTGESGKEEKHLLWTELRRTIDALKEAGRNIAAGVRQGKYEAERANPRLGL